MTLSLDIILFLCLAYVVALFVIAFLVDRSASRGKFTWLRSPVVYTLSISVYCTSWTFYGAVGSAARNGLEFITIYLGPTLVFIGWWWLLRKLVRIGREHRITSIADLISSRYGKSPSLAVLVTLIAVVATTPYIALQLQSVTRSYEAIAGPGAVDPMLTALIVAGGMALFTILFGTRNLDAHERHHGVVAAIAVEAVVKLFALLAVGLFVVWGAGGLGQIFEDVPTEIVYGGDNIFGPRWVTLMFLSATAIICLPRQFQVTVVENVDERHLSTAAWLFPAYLFGMCIFIVPIAIAGLKTLPGANPDLYVLTLPLAAGRNDLALLAFLGGFSSATSMVIVAAIAVSTMVSNHIVMPVALRFMDSGREVSGDVRRLLLASRRVSIAAVLGLGFLYFQLSGGSDALAAIGLIAFVGVAQFLPSLLGGIFWRGATRAGALTGLIAGFFLWAYTLFLPSFGGDFLLSAAVLENGPWGISALRPQALFGMNETDPLVHAVVWSVGINSLLFLIVSVLSEAQPLERLQAAQFVNIFGNLRGRAGTAQIGTATSDDLFILAQRILGTDPARRLFDEMAQAQGQSGRMPDPTEAVINRLERELAGSVGAASAHAMVGRIAGTIPVGMTELIDIADETQRLIETSRALSEKSDELERAAQQLRDANDRLRRLDAQKDAFLTQVSHELRTPMTAIRSFANILMGEGGVAPDERAKFVSIIHEESLRLTRLLDEILDVSHLEAGAQNIPVERLTLNDEIAGAEQSVLAFMRDAGVRLRHDLQAGSASVWGNSDRLRQVLINILGNAVKYNRSQTPEIVVASQETDAGIYVDIIDNGGGVPEAEASTVFEKFARGENTNNAQGAGLGLPISRAIMRAMGGDLAIVFNDDGSSFFRLTMVPASADAPSATQGQTGNVVPLATSRA